MSKKIIRFEVPSDYAQAFENFAKLAVIRGVKLPELFGEAVVLETSGASTSEQVQFADWVNWDDFEKGMLAGGYSVNRVTFWKYRNDGHFTDMVKTNGVNTLFNLPRILEYYKGGKVN